MTKHYKDWLRDYFKEKCTNADWDWLYVPKKSQILAFDKVGNKVFDSYGYNDRNFLVYEYGRYSEEQHSITAKLDKIIELLEKR